MITTSNVTSVLSSIIELNSSSMSSETEVRTKVAIPLLECLGHLPVNRAEEFPVWMNFGGKKETKKADIILFSSNEYDSYKIDSPENRAWIANHALLVVELKKPLETICGALGQAMSYVMWTKVLYYIVTNGLYIEIYKVIEGAADKPVVSCAISSLHENWTEIEKHISFTELQRAKSNIIENSQSVIRRYDNYCLSVLSAYIPEHAWRVEQSFKDNSSYKDIISTSKVIITAPSGYGKTYCLYNIAQIQAIKYLSGECDIIPVVLRCNLWRRSFNTLLEGIYSELHIYTPSLTLAGVTSELHANKLLLLLDGLNECKVDNDILLKEIASIASCNGGGVIITSQQDAALKTLCSTFIMREINNLSEPQISDAAYTTLGSRTALSSEGSKAFKDLLRVPMFLSIYLSLLQEGLVFNNKPKNLAVIFDRYVAKLLEKRISTNVPTPDATLRRILSSFAFETITNPKGNIDITSIIQKILPGSIVSDVFKELIDSKIICQYNGIADFQFEAVKEYFCSTYLASCDEKQICEYIDSAVFGDGRDNILALMFGSINDFTIQANLLDYLESTNLALYVKCLYARYNFSNEYLDNMNRPLCENMFKQIIISYENIVRTHFPNIIRNFYPWQGYSSDIDLESIIAIVSGNIDLRKMYIDISIDGVTRADDVKRIDIEFTDATNHISFMNNDGERVETPLFSSTDNVQYFGYNLNYYYSGIDSAREIAVKIVYQSLKKIIESDVLLMFEHPYSQCEYVEHCLSEIPRDELAKILNVELPYFSMWDIAPEQLKMLLRPAINLVYRRRDWYNKNNEISIMVLYALAAKILESGIDQTFPLQPKRDYSLPPSEGSGLQLNENFSGYSIAQLKDWLARYYDAYQISYRHYVDNVTPTLKNDLTLYHSGPLQFRVVIYFDDIANRISAHEATVNISWLARRTISECSTLVEIKEVSTHCLLSDLSLDEPIKSLRFLGRKGVGIEVSNTILSKYVTSFNERGSIRDEVRERILRELKSVFKERM